MLYLRPLIFEVQKNNVIKIIKSKSDSQHIFLQSEKYLFNFIN